MTKNLDEFQIGKDSSLKDAMEAMTANRRGLVFIVDENKKAIGMLTDGDIRRALLRSITFLAPAMTIANPHFVVSATDDRTRIKKLMQDNKVYAIPIVDGNYRLLDIVFAEELYP